MYPYQWQYMSIRDRVRPYPADDVGADDERACLQVRRKLLSRSTDNTNYDRK